jgi:hypothetical protein
MAFLGKVIVNRGMGGCKFPQGLHCAKSVLRSLAASEGQAGILGCVVEVAYYSSRAFERRL